MEKWKSNLLGVVGAVIALSKPILWLIDRLAEVDFVNAHLGEFGQFLGNGMGTLITVLGGMGLIAWAIHLRHPIHVHHKEVQAQTAPQALLSMVVHRAEPTPDWPIRDLVFHIKPNVSNEYPYSEFYAVAGQIVDKFSTGTAEMLGPGN